MKYSLLFLAAFIYSCDKVGDIIDNEAYDPPVINDLKLTPSVVYPGDTLKAVVTATNPEKGLMTYNWVATGGQFIQPANEDTVYWIAPFQGGNYDITVTVSNEKKDKKATEKVNVISSIKPIVEIQNPEQGAFFVPGEQILVNAVAFHDNGLNFVKLFAGDIAVDSTDFNSSNEYQLIYESNFSMIGSVTLKIEAEAFGQKGNTGMDSVIVNIEGILPKTGN